jgi:hypothetical protein
MALTKSERKLYNKLVYKLRYGTKEGRKKNALRMKLYRDKLKK